MISRGGYNLDLTRRIPEPEEVLSDSEAKAYATRKDNRALTYSMVAQDIRERITSVNRVKTLEVCCGAGQLVSALHKITQNPNLYATDGSPILIEEARKRDPCVKFDVQNVHNHPGKGTYELVICKDSFHHFLDPKRGILDLLALTSLGGYVYIFDLNRDCPTEQVKSRLKVIQNVHEGRRFLQSLNASSTVGEFYNLLRDLPISEASVFYPFKFSENNLSVHARLIKQDKTKEHMLNRLFSVYVLRK